MIRLLLPAILGFAFSLIFLWVAYAISMKYTQLEKDVRKQIRNFCLMITAIAFLFFGFYAANIYSVNSISRTDIDRSAQREGVQNFENQLMKDTITIKNK